MTTRRATVQVILKDAETGELIGPSAPFSRRAHAVLAVETPSGWREVRRGDEWAVRAI